MSDRPEIKHTALFEMDGLMREKLAEGGRVTFSPKGVSMRPMLNPRGDSVTLELPAERLRPGAVALFVSGDSDGGQKYILHRLVKRRKAGLVFMGDSRREADPPVREEDVIGVVTGFVHNGKSYTGREPGMRLYARWMVLTRNLRGPALWAQGAVLRIRRRLNKRGG